MKRPSFLERKTLGQPNYILIAMAIAFAAALAPRGAQLAVESATNTAEDWLPANSAELADFAWFREQFPATEPTADETNVVASADLALPLALAGLGSLAVAYACLHSLILGGIVVASGVLSAAMSLAIRYYYGAFESAIVGSSAHTGAPAAVLLLMGLVVYVASISGAIYLVNYYRHARRGSGVRGAAEQAVRMGWAPCAVTTLAILAGLAPLWVSDIPPVQQFGIFTSIGLVVAFAMLITLMPVVLHCVPARVRRAEPRDERGTSGWLHRLSGLAIHRPAWTFVAFMVLLGASALGTAQLEMSTQPFDSLAPDGGDSVQNAASLEVVLTVPPQQIREADEPAEGSGRQFRMSTVERLALVREIEVRVATVPEIGDIVSAASHVRAGVDEHSETDFDANFRRREASGSSAKAKSRRELWRISGQVANGADSSQLMGQLREAVDPVLLAYQQRDRIVARLHEAGKRLEGSQLCILYRTPVELAPSALGAQEAVLANLLQRSGLKPRELPDGTAIKALSSFNLALLDKNQDNPQYLDAVIKALSEQDALVLVSAGTDPTAQQLAEGGVTVIDVSNLPIENSAPAVAVVYAGAAPTAGLLQRRLPVDFKQWTLWATFLLAAVLTLTWTSPLAGVVSLIPICLPLVISFGVMGALGFPLDMGLLATAYAVLGVAVGGTVHYLTWLRRGLNAGLDRKQAGWQASDRCTPAIVQTTLIVGLGLAALTMTPLVPLQRAGILLLPMLGSVLVCTLFLLPAIAASDLGRLFGAAAANAAALQVPHEAVTAPVEAEAEPRPLLEPVAAADYEPEQPPPEEELVVAYAHKPVMSDEERSELLAGPHAALHAKLRSLRRELPQGGVSP